MGDVWIRRDRHAGRITLSRPQALNALGYGMITAIQQALDDWRSDPSVSLILVDAEGARAFCAGGDIGATYHLAKSGNHREVGRFFADEYRMNATIADYPKPVAAFMQGFVLGGGVGIGGHASCRVVGDTTQIGMPETLIGLVPDVGGSWLLAHAPGRIGEYVGLTGARMGAADAIHAGFADHYIPEAEWPALIDAAAETGSLAHLRGHPVGRPPLAERDLSAFGGRDLSAIRQSLERSQDTDTLATLEQRSPLSLAATLQMIRAARSDQRMQDALAREYRFTSRATEHADFLEGVRAQIIDKDRAPRWRKRGDPAEVAALLAPLGMDELRLP